MCIRVFLTVLLFGLFVSCHSGWQNLNWGFDCYPPRSGEQLAELRKANALFEIKTLVFRERTSKGGPNLLGAYYIFEAKAREADEWREVMIFRHDNPEPIGEDRSKFIDDRVVFVSDRVAFVYMGWMYAVTTDEGKSWSVWNGIQYPFSQGRMGYDGIRDVQLQANGVGVMKVALIGNDDLKELRTHDYGVTWDTP